MSVVRGRCGRKSGLNGMHTTIRSVELQMTLITLGGNVCVCVCVCVCDGGRR